MSTKMTPAKLIIIKDIIRMIENELQFLKDMIEIKDKTNNRRDKQEKRRNNQYKNTCYYCGKKGHVYRRCFRLKH